MLQIMPYTGTTDFQKLKHGHMFFMMLSKECLGGKRISML